MSRRRRLGRWASRRPARSRGRQRVEGGAAQGGAHRVAGRGEAGAGRECRHCEQLERENARLRRDVSRLQEQLARLRERFDREVRRLKDLLEKARRAGKRQAAPFSKGEPKHKPRRPGRRSGSEHGRHGHRRAPARVDEVLDAPLPARSACCAAPIAQTSVEAQYHVEIPKVEPRITQFNVHIGCCGNCGKRCQGRHPRQTCDALGAAAVQLGPNAVAVAADLHTGLGLSFGKVGQVFGRLFSISITRGGLCQALHRLARKAQPTYGALKQAVREAAVVSPDETGWKVGGQLHWLWVTVTRRITLYAILPGRGFEEAASILGEDFAGTLARDGWGPYRKFLHATHQTCNAHLLRRCHERLETAQRGAARVPHAVRRLLLDALAVRDRRDEGCYSPHGLAVVIGRLEARRDRLLAWEPRDDDNRRLLKHLRNERDALLTFLECPEVPATNFWAEQEIRPAVVIRKVFGGNRTWRGAHTQEVIASVLRTSVRQEQDPYALFVRMQCSPTPLVASWLCSPNVAPPPAPSSSPPI